MKPKTIINKIQQAIDILEQISDDNNKYLKYDIEKIIDQLMDIGMAVEMGE